MPRTKKLLLALAATSALTACGGGASGDPEPVVAPGITPTALKGVMVDGYVSGATVVCDSNGNGRLDTGEASTTTNGGGVFEFPNGCSAPIVGFGGTNIDTGFAFQGVLKAPAGSVVVTPLTTLLVGSGLTNAQLSALMGLPAGTDLTKVDPADGKNDELFKKTLATQQLLDSLARATAAKTGSTDVKGTYERIAADFGKGLAAKPEGTQLIGTDGQINNTALTALVTALPDVVALQLAAADLRATAESLAKEAERFSKASAAQLVELSKQLQSPSRAPINVVAGTNFLALKGDGFTMNGAFIPNDLFAAGIRITGLESLGFTFNVVGAPAAQSTVDVALELSERGGDRRRLQLMIEGVSITVDAQGQVGVRVADGAKVYAYGVTANGTEVNMTLSDLSFSPIRVQNNGFSLNYTNVVSKVASSADVAGRTTAERFLAIKGSFDVKLVVAGMNVRKPDGTSFATGSVQLVNSSKGVSGPMLAGSMTIE